MFPRIAISWVLVLLTAVALGMLSSKSNERYTAIATFNGHVGDVPVVAWSADEKRIASAGIDGKLIVWDVGSGKPVAKTTGPSKAPYSAAFSPDGTHLIVGYKDTPAIVWGFGENNAVRLLKNGKRRSWLAALSPSNKLAATLDTDGVLRLWDAKTGRYMRAGIDEFNQNLIVSQPEVLRFGGDDTLVYAVHNDTATAFNTNTGLQLRSYGGGYGGTYGEHFRHARRGGILSEKKYDFDFRDPILFDEAPPQKVSGAFTLVNPLTAPATAPALPPAINFAIAATPDASRFAVGGLDGSVTIVRPAIDTDWLSSKTMIPVIVLGLVLLAWLIFVYTHGGHLPLERISIDEFFDPNATAPTALKLVAYLFILFGGAMAASTVYSVQKGETFINPLAINLLTGWMLLRCRWGWWKFALLQIWAAMFITALTLGVVLHSNFQLIETITLELFALEVPPWINATIAAGLFAILTAIVFALTHPATVTICIARTRGL